MRILRYFGAIALIFIPIGSFSEPLQDIQSAAKAAFARMPDVRVVPQIKGECGADDSVTDLAAYCTSSNEILVQAGQSEAAATYGVAHAYGHAVQVRHGVADIALREIRARRAEEPTLRGYVDRQVDCIAGFLVAAAGLGPMSLADIFKDDPFDDIHWGRDPLRVGPVMPVSLADRDVWFAKGQAGDIADCAVGEFGSELLVIAYQG